MERYSTKNMYLAKMGYIYYDDENGKYHICNDEDDDIINRYTVVYFKNGDVAYDTFSKTKYCVFDKQDWHVCKYCGTEGIVSLSPITEYMTVPSSLVGSDELVKILNDIDLNRKENINDLVLLIVCSLNNKASNILIGSDLQIYRYKLLTLSYKYLHELALSRKENSSNNKVDVTYKYLKELSALDKELTLNDDERIDYDSEYQKIKLILQL